MRPLAAAFTLAVMLAPAAPAALAAQAVVDPGMTKAQVVAKLGRPAVERTAGTATYLYYRNGVERTAGMSDIVVLEDDKVVDAIFRSSARKYSGKSSSPAAIPAEVARKHPPVTPPPEAPMAAPAVPAAAPAPAPPSGARATQKMPAEKAQEAQIVAPVPPARSAILEREKAAARAADSAKAAKAAKTDSSAAKKKPQT